MKQRLTILSALFVAAAAIAAPNASAGFGSSPGKYRPLGISTSPGDRALGISTSPGVHRVLGFGTSPRGIRSYR